MSNPAFQKIFNGRVPDDLDRVRMAVNVPPTDPNLLKVIGGMIGQDLTRVTLPGTGP